MTGCCPIVKHPNDAQFRRAFLSERCKCGEVKDFMFEAILQTGTSQGKLAMAICTQNSARQRHSTNHFSAKEFHHIFGKPAFIVHARHDQLIEFIRPQFG